MSSSSFNLVKFEYFVSKVTFVYGNLFPPAKEIKLKSALLNNVLYFCAMQEASIYPLSIPFILYRVAGLLEPIPAGIGRAAGYILDRSPVSHRANI